MLACDGVLWPWWDHREANFVARLLTYMKPVPDDGGATVWVGPGVETKNTALVTGRMSVVTPPKADNLRDWFGGKVYDGCSFAYQQMEVKARNYLTFSEGWKEYGGAHDIEGSGYYIGKWSVDPRFFGSKLAPKEEISANASGSMGGLNCPDGYDECRIVESCIKLSDYSIIGNVTGTRAEGHRINLPNDSLIDYPLFQAGKQTPEEFSKNYKLRMAERVKVYPLYEAIAVFIMCCMMLVLSRREIGPERLLREPHAAVIALVTAIMATTRSTLDHVMIWLVLGTPWLPVVAYQNITDSGLFSMLLCGYIFCFLMMLCGLELRWKKGPQPIGKDDSRDPTLPPPMPH